MASIEDRSAVQKILNMDVLIPASLVLGIGSFLIWSTNTLSDMTHKLEDIDKKISVVITEEKFENWTLKLKISNPLINVPDAPKH